MSGVESGTPELANASRPSKGLRPHPRALPVALLVAHVGGTGVCQVDPRGEGRRRRYGDDAAAAVAAAPGLGKVSAPADTHDIVRG